MVTNTGDSSVLTSGSLRAAILNADASPGSTINFNIGASGVVETITPASALPVITAAVTIDATTEAGYSSSPLINLNGAGLNANGLQITASNTTVRGLAVGAFGQTGILISGGATGDLITNDFVGTNATGTVAAANAIGIEISGSANNTLNNDLVSGNTGNGVVITGSGSTGNVVVNCEIGTNAAGTQKLGNGDDGVYAQSASNTIGGTAAGAGNLISGNSKDGVELEASNNLVEGNLIGTNAAGTAALGNGLTGVYVGAASNTIGGTTAAARNVISGNGTVGIEQAIALAAGQQHRRGELPGHRCDRHDGGCRQARSGDLRHGRVQHHRRHCQRRPAI